jgi:hypothetical protein
MNYELNFNLFKVCKVIILTKVPCSNVVTITNVYRAGLLACTSGCKKTTKQAGAELCQAQDNLG